MTSVQQPHTDSNTPQTSGSPGFAFPWRVESDRTGAGWHLVNANGEEVALFETSEEAEFVLTAVHNQLQRAGLWRMRGEWSAEAVLRREG